MKGLAVSMTVALSIASRPAGLIAAALASFT
jgi:hypothetical protein